MAFTFTRSQLKTDVNRRIHGRIGMLVDVAGTLNSAVRQVNNDFETLASRRQAALTPNLYNGIYDYYCPADLDGFKIIDIPAQAKRADGEFYLVPTTEFAIGKQKGMISIKDFNGTRLLQINSNVDSKTIVVSELDSFESGGGLWELFGDAQYLGDDDADFVKGSGSLTFDISSAGGTTAGIFNSSVNPVDLSEYLAGTSSFFIWAKIPSVTGITNFKLRFGNDSSNYYTLTATSRADGTAFTNGWNLIRFDADFNTISETGAPDETNLTYFAIYMTKATSKVSETDYKFDWLVIKKGIVHNVDYYSNYGWQSSAGAYKANSTDDLDVLVAGNDEYEIILDKAVEMAAEEVKEYDISREAERKYMQKVKAYQLRNPSEAKIMTSEYFKY